MALPHLPAPTNLTHQEIPVANTTSNDVKFVKTDYQDVKELSNILQGIHTVLSFISPHLDQEEAFNVQKNLIDASVAVGVKRFAPSEWAS